MMLVCMGGNMAWISKHAGESISFLRFKFVILLPDTNMNCQKIAIDSGCNMLRWNVDENEGELLWRVYYVVYHIFIAQWWHISLKKLGQFFDIS
jgi:hypothetical protein